MTIIAIYARDWGVYADQIAADHDFALTYGWIVGRLIREDDEKVIVAHHWFPADDQLRHVTTVQKSCIIRRRDWTVKI